MPKTSYSKIILKHLEYIYKGFSDKENAWVPSYELEKINTPFGWIGTSGRRRVQELFEKGLVDRKIEGRYAYYRHKPKEIFTYKPKIENKLIKLF